MGMTTVYAMDEIRKDAHELTKIAIEDGISKTQVVNMFYPLKHGSMYHWSMEKIIEDVKQYSNKEFVVSEIVERPVLSKRYVEKVLFVIHKYYRRPNDLSMLARSTTILYDDQKEPT
jgi:hypothetical protein